MTQGKAKDEELDKIFNKPAGKDAFYLEGEIRPAFQSLLERRVLEGRIEELERLKQYHGAYIGIDGKRIDNMVHHQIIDERIAELSRRGGGNNSNDDLFKRYRGGIAPL